MRRGRKKTEISLAVTVVSILLLVRVLAQWKSIFRTQFLPTENVRNTARNPFTDSSHNTSNEFGSTKGDVCSYFPRPFTPSSLWKKYLPTILNASHHPDKPELTITTEMESLLYNTLSTFRLRKAVRSMPSHSVVQHVMKIIETRIKDKSGTAPPLQIAVLGGSVTVGRRCDGSKAMVNRDCAWPRRFEFLVNQFLGFEAIKVHNIAVGGTDTSQGKLFIKYWMLPAELQKHGPDVIINSYSTNDSLPPWKSTEDPIISVMNKARNKLQDFVRTALLSKPCSSAPPLVVHVDDYLGHQQDAVLGEMSYNTAMVQVSRWYETMAVSYADVVRDIVYNNTSETTFSARWTRIDRKTGKWARESHFGNHGHMTVSWVLAFSVLELLSVYCDDQSDDSVDISRTTSKRAFSLPPPLTSSLEMEKVSKEWQASKVEAEKRSSSLDCSKASSSTNPCVVAWIAGPTGFNANQLKRFMRKHSHENTGWKTEQDMRDGWSQKVGWVASHKNAKFTMKVPNLQKEVRVISIVYMKSYGEKWENSVASFTFSGGDRVELSGHHNSTTSIAYTEQILLSKPQPEESTLSLSVELVSGNTFKILGMMMCSW